MSIIYNQSKLSEEFYRFKNKKILIIGVGAVGTYVAELVAKLGVGNITLVDNDSFTIENAAKHSALITEKRAGHNKAIATAEALRPLMIPNGIVRGLDAEVATFAHHFFENFDAVLLAVDNMAAKIYFNDIWVQIPLHKRPLLIIGGTFNEMAHCNTLDGTAHCFECLVDPTWLKNATVRTSCTAPSLRVKGLESQGIVRTSNRASARAAIMMVDSFEAYIVQRENSPYLNRRVVYDPRSTPMVSISRPLSRKSCSACNSEMIENVIELPGSVLNTTLNTFVRRIRDQLESDDFGIKVHHLNYPEVAYAGLIAQEKCLKCNKEIQYIGHTFYTKPKDLTCEECSSIDYELSEFEIFHTITPRKNANLYNMIKYKTLFELGYPLGANIYVFKDNNKSVLDPSYAFKETIVTMIDDYSESTNLYKESRNGK